VVEKAAAAKVAEAQKAQLEERVGKMEAQVVAAEMRWKLENAALASSNTELLRYKRACVYMCGTVDRPTSSPLPSPRPPVHMYPSPPQTS